MPEAKLMSLAIVWLTKQVLDLIVCLSHCHLVIIILRFRSCICNSCPMFYLHALKNFPLYYSAFIQKTYKSLVYLVD